MTHKREWRVWSDGSSLGNPGPAGWAILVESPNGETVRRHGSADHRTNNQAELFALMEGIKAIPVGERGVVFSDSQYAITAATVHRAGWERNGMRTADKSPVKNADRIMRLWQVLDERPGVRLEWVRAHANNGGNETVDGLARRAAEAVRAGKKPVAGVTEKTATTASHLTGITNI